MGECCGNQNSGCTSGGVKPADGPLAWFGQMIPNALAYVKEAHEQGRPIVGIMCEYTPRELIMAAGAVSVCLCGGDQNTIPAAETQLPSNLCPLIKSTFGYAVQKSNPFLEMASLVVAETTCDGKKKMYELLSESVPMHLLELPQTEGGEDAYVLWRKEMDKLKTALETRFDVEITPEKLTAAIQTMNRERALRRSLAETMKCDSPPLTGLELLTLKSSVSGICADFAQYEKALDLCKERGPRPDAKSRVRVLMTGVPIVHGAERVLEIVEDSGGLVVSMENCTGLKPIVEDVNVNGGDPMDALSQKYFHLPCSVMTRNEGRLDLLRDLVREYKPDCVIDLIWQACLTYDVESFRVRRFVEEELKLPYLKIETDYSPSDSARIAVRVEALYETVRNAKGR